MIMAQASQTVASQYAEVGNDTCPGFAVSWRRCRAHGQSGQTVFEIAMVFIVVAAAVVGMAIYMKRGLSGKLRNASDSMGEQYHPGMTSSNITTQLNNVSTTTSTLVVDQAVDALGTKGNVMEYQTEVSNSSNVSGSESVGAATGSIWN
jgi:hypothetical protein